MSDCNSEDLEQLRFTTQYVVDLIYDTLECLDQVLRKNDIPYVIFGGTALGAERHGGLIPWDDDADLCILADDEQRLISLADTFSDYGFTLTKEPFFGYRLYHSTLAEPRARDQYPYPFVDIFLINDTGSSYEYTTEKSRTLWPQEPLPYGCFNRLVDVPFGHLMLRGLSSSDVHRHLDENYGKDWPYVAWRDYDHYYYKGVSNACIKLHDRNERRAVQHSKFQHMKQCLTSNDN